MNIYFISNIANNTHSWYFLTLGFVVSVIPRYNFLPRCFSNLLDNCRFVFQVVSKFAFFTFYRSVISIFYLLGSLNIFVIRNFLKCSTFRRCIIFFESSLPCFSGPSTFGAIFRISIFSKFFFTNFTNNHNHIILEDYDLYNMS